MVVEQDPNAGEVTITGFGGSDTGNDGTGMFDQTLTDGENPFFGVSTPGRGTETDTTDGFGDGSNEWIPGVRETLANPVDRATNPIDTVAGAADAAALNFDEGVGGLVSLIDNEPGNTAGPGDSAAFDPDGDGEASVGEQVDAALDLGGNVADAAGDTAPGWVTWLLDHQEEALIGGVVLLALFATEGTVGTPGGA